MFFSQGRGTLEYESDGYVSSGERKQRAFGVGFRRKYGAYWLGDPRKLACGVNFANNGSFGVNFGQI